MGQRVRQSGNRVVTYAVAARILVDSYEEPPPRRLAPLLTSPNAGRKLYL